MRDYRQEFVNYLSNEKGYSNHTIINYKMDLDNFYFFIKNEKADYQLIRKYINYLYDQNYQSKTMCRHISTLKSYFKFLVKQNYIKENPMILISTPKIEQKLPQYLNYKELEALLSTPDQGTFLGLRNSLILELLYSTGIRVSELVNIKISDIDLSNYRIKVIGKGNKERLVFFGKKCYELLINYLDNRDESCQYLLVNKNNQQLTDRGIRYIMDKIVKDSALKLKISPHTLRHTFATHLLNEGAELKSVQDLMGHESIATTGIYTHVSIEHLRKTYLDSHPRAKKQKSDE